MGHRTGKRIGDPTFPERIEYSFSFVNRTTVEELVRILTRGHLSVIHFVVFCTQSLSQTTIKFLA